MAHKGEQWRDALDRSAQLWRGGEEAGALKALEDALIEYPRQPLLRMQKYYMEKAVEYRDNFPRIEMPPRKPGDPAVSVIMATYNRTTWIRESIESVIAQSFADWELLIVNDGGSTEVEEIISGCNDQRIRYFRVEHGGKSAALNAALRRARGRYIGILDDDDIYQPEHLEKHVDALQANPSAPLAYSDAIMALQEMGEDGEYRIYRRTVAKNFDFDRKVLGQRNFLATCAILIRREGFEKQGGFNETLLNGEDWEMWLRLCRDGDFVRVPGASCEFRHREDGSSITSNRGCRPMHFHNVVGTMSGEVLFDGNSLTQKSGQRAIRALGWLLDFDPQMIDTVAIYKLLEARKPYRYFENLAGEFAREGDWRGERAALKAAIRSAPHEVKLWFRLLKEIIRNER